MYSYDIYLLGVIMFCPKCRSEYVSGITTCSDCGIPLVESLAEPEQNESEQYKYVEILETFNLADIAFIKSLFDEYNIQYFFLNESFNTLEPVEPARLVVREDQADNAKELLKDADLNYVAFTVDANEKEENK